MLKKEEQMTRTMNWPARVFYILIALALVIGLAGIAAPTASADTETEVCGCLVAGGTGTAVWDSTTTKVGTYSAKLYAPGPSGGYGKVVMPLEMEFEDLEDFSVYLNGGASPQDLPMLGIELDATSIPSTGIALPGGGTSVPAGTFSRMQITSQPLWATTLKGLQTAGDSSWQLYSTDGTGAFGADGAVWNVWWAFTGTAYTNSYKTGVGTYLTWAEIQAAFGSIGVTIQDFRVENSYPEANSTVNVDDIMINDTTYDLEPCYFLVPDIAKNVKTADGTFTVMDACGNPIGASIEVQNWFVTKGEGVGEVIKVAGGMTDDDYITVRMITTGDCIITCDVDYDGDGIADATLDAEKKWGEIAWTELTAWSATPCVQRPTGAGDNQISRAGIEVDEEVLVQEEVIAYFLPGPVPAPAGGAKITWWLLENDEADVAQTALEVLVDRFATSSHASGDLGYGEGCGQYGVWAGDPTFIPEDIINGIYATCEATNTLFTDAECADIADTTKTVTYTDDALEPLGEGFTNVTVKFSEFAPEEAEPVIVVVLADYPRDKNGENAVCVEYFKFSPKPHVPTPEVCQVKVPQVRWAGEKIVLEKDWGSENGGMLVGYYLEEGTVANMIPRIELPGEATDYYVSEDARTVITETDVLGVSRAVMESEQQGEADVKCVLYGTGVEVVTQGDLEEMLQGEYPTDWPPDEWIVIGNHGFLVYYLALEDVTVDADLSDLTGNVPDDDANVLVQVRGWFTSDALPGTSRLPVDADGDLVYELPGKRYVLPDDWAALAGSYMATSKMASRPQYDLMNTPGWGVDSDFELGPFDSGVRTTTPPGLADNPVIGPFNTTQPWNCYDALGNPTNMWIADDVVIADSTVAAVTTEWDANDLRNTVVPDYWIDEWDCPMPQALVTFDAWGTNVLSALDKGTVLGYGINAADKYIAPFYQMEIPSHWFIPQAGYLWDSWEETPVVAYPIGPYDMWTDLDNTPNDDDILEVYCDNHGYAGVTVDALPEEGSVWLDVIADFPVMQCKYAAVDTWTDVVWGPPTPATATWYFTDAGVWPKPVAGWDDELWADYNMEDSPAGELPVELIAVYYQNPDTLEWTFFVKAWKGTGDNTLESLLTSGLGVASFYCQVSAGFDWEIPQV